MNEFQKLFYKTRNWLGPNLIFVMVMIAFPLSLNIYSAELETSFESILVIALLMIAFISSEGIFNEDFLDGSFEMFISEGRSLFQLVMEKFCAYYFMVSLPISLAALAFALANGVIKDNYLLTASGVFFVNTIFTSIFAFGSAISLNKGAILGIISVLPFSMPAVIVFGRFLDNLSVSNISFSFLELLAGLSIMSFLIFAWLSSKIIKLHLE
ncbi:MAG: heme exporter protein CcmB [Gammaproteobacteria bacterium]